MKDIYLELSNKLFEVFYVDDKKYGRQQEDSTYKLVKERISPVTVEDMLKKQKSLLTYQELHIVGNALIKWICIDLDINKKEIDSNEVNKENLKLVKEAANEVCEFLDSINVPYLLEFSGRRGFHIWIIFDRLITKENGFRFINFIISKVNDKFNKIIIADKFPKTAYVNPKSKGVGFGIKLPLSQNKGNGKLSFFLKKNDLFEYDQDKWLSKPNHDFLVNQFNILSSLELVSLSQIQPYIDEYYSSIGIKKFSEKFLITKKINSFLPDNIDLETILLSLRKCEHLDKILYDYEKGLSGKERGVLVGLLGQLKTKDDNDFGHKILMELFSNIQDFSLEKTENNLNNLKYFQPITCSNFGTCKSCEQCNLTSPIELIDDVELIDKPSYSIRNLDENLFENLKNSIYQYSLKNDEVPLYPQLRKSSNLTLTEIEKNITSIYKGDYPYFFDSYSFKRNELTKVRTLYNLDTTNNFISTYFTFVLNTIYYTEISNNSYGYQFNGHLAQNNIFNNWFFNWAKFSREIEKVLFSEEYEDFFVLKLDIKSFYDKIDLKRLKIKLYEEAPSNIKEKLNDLSDEDRIKYKHIINYLIDLSVKTTNSEIGLPQGPAYARYLAELYLNGLDTLIEKTFITDQRREFYNRFVDDIFIFVESKERAHVLYSKIKEWLSINNLDLNSEKSKVLNVKEYAESGDYHRYKDNIKYDINFVNKNKNVLSEEEIQKAISDLEDLTNNEKFGLKDNLRFFYNQFKGDKRLNFLRTKLSKRLPFSNDGRGTLYMLFYTDLLANFSDTFWCLAYEVDKIKGLSLTHYLNTILLNEDLINDNLNSINILIENCIKKTDISDADKLLIASICVKCNLNIKLNYPREIMNSALEIPNMKYTIQMWDLMNEKLKELKDKEEFLIELERIIYNNTYDVDFLNKLSQYSFLRFTQWKSENYNFIENELLNSYYHCLCFLTLFYNSTDSINLVKSWEFLLDESKRIGKISDDNHQFKWLNKALEFDYNEIGNGNGSYLLILSDKNGSKLGEIPCSNNFIKSYKEVLITLLFSKRKEENTELNDFKLLDDLSYDKDSLFYKWIEDASVNLYPDNDEQDICLKNIALNGLIILKKENKIFLKNLNKEIDFQKFDYLKISNNSNGQEVEFEFDNSCLSDKLFNTNLFQVLKNINQIITAHKSFTEKFRTKLPVFYYPAFEYSNMPVVPFYSEFEELISNEGKIVNNSIEHYWENLYFIISKKNHNSSTIKLSLDDNKFNFSIENLDTRFFPESTLIVNSVNDKIKFLNMFIDFSNEAENISLFEYQYYWSCTVYEFVKVLNNNIQDFINYLKVHFDLFTKDNYKMDIFFSVNKNFELNDKTLKDFFQTIKKSIYIFQSEVSVNNHDFIKMIEEYIPIKKDDEEYPFDIENFNLIKLLVVELEKNRVSGFNKLAIKINDDIIGEDLKIYMFDDYKRSFEIKTIEEISTLTVKEKIFMHQLQNEIFLYQPENEVLNAFNRIYERKALLEDLNGTPEPTLSKLFPVNEYYSIASASLKNKTSLISKLKHHYNNEFNIEDRIINWLTIFNEKSIEDSILSKFMHDKFTFENLYDSLLIVLDKHIALETKYLDFFLQKMKTYNNDNYKLFTIKNPANDQNGLFRLMDKLNAKKVRNSGIDFEQIFNSLCSSQVYQKELIIISDISISGDQFSKAFSKYYFKNFKDNEELNDYFLKGNEDVKKPPFKEKYFNFITKEKSEIFQANIRSFEKITFLSPMMTESFKEVVNSLFEVLKITSKLEFDCLEPALTNNYFYKDISFNQDRKELFEQLITDVELLSKLFKMNSKAKGHYKKSLEEIDNANLILRVGSLPKKHLKMFTLEPKKGKAALDYINELN